MNLAEQHCFHHAQREAAARCPECRRFFCRECVTEHEDRVVCAACLKVLTAARSGGKVSIVWLVRTLQLVWGLLVALVFFYWLGQTLLDLPSSFHDGTVWQGRWLEDTR
jgi:hypothetical protein